VSAAALVLIFVKEALKGYDAAGNSKQYPKIS
jgi:hypothetical protein